MNNSVPRLPDVLPSWVMLELAQLDFSQALELSLADKRHNCILDREYIVPNVTGVGEIRQCIGRFVESLQKNGVI